MTKVAILWHMHQPNYEDLATGEHIMPWVRLHALKDYYGMVALLREFPDVRMTFNLVPSLLVQLEAFAEDRAKDRCLDLSLKPAENLGESDVDFILANFFHAQQQRMIDIYPRYRELLARRGGAPATPDDRRATARRFGADDLRDLQVWHKLAWIDPLYLDHDPRIQALLSKGSRFTEEDKLSLREVELEILNKVIPEYRDAAARGQVELSASPFHHPILPLLCDSDVYLLTHPDARRPRQRFVHPEDAAEQLARAAACHERLFGRRPVGLWPSEGSVSDAMVPLVAQAGFRWMATDELILARTLNTVFTRDGYGHVEQPEQLYAPYTVHAGGASVACAFRDHSLSDLIGFHYSRWSADAAADDFVGKLAEAGRRYSERTGGGEAFLPIILDGENAWEHFEGGGRPFLRALYSRLSGHPELRTVTMAEGCAAPSRELASIFAGSWIDANFYIWIGHADDQRGWSQLADARQALDEARATPGVDVATHASRVAAAREEVFIAEGSDWFWWYGDDHSSEHDLEFDDLFRRHLRNAYRLLDKPVPEELFVSNISTRGTSPAEVAPTALITPILDGEETSYFEWLGAGSLEIREIAGAMHESDRREFILTAIRFGFDRENLYLRLDGARPLSDVLAGDAGKTGDPGKNGENGENGDPKGYDVWLQFQKPAGVRIRVRQLRSVRVAAILECGIPFADLGLAPGAPMSFFVGVSAPDGTELERHPAWRPIEITVPDEKFEARHWTA